jgi:hypothetical protein
MHEQKNIIINVDLLAGDAFRNCVVGRILVRSKTNANTRMAPIRDCPSRKS